MTKTIGFTLTAFLLCLLWDFSATAQGGTWKFGFELGATRSTLTGDQEKDDSGANLEELNFNGGFHLSFYGRRHITDEFGIQVGLAYAQRGLKKTFKGPSYYVFGQAGTQLRSVNLVNRFESIKIQSGYLDLPVIAFYKIGKRFEVGLGAYGAVMLNAKGSGEYRISPIDDEFSTFLVIAEHNYFKDDYGDDPIGSKFVDVDGIPYVEPIAMKAYHEYLEAPVDNYYKRIDYGLIGQVGVYLNESLNIKGRVMYGLADLTNSSADFSKYKYENTSTLISRDDKDRSLSIQISLGFLF